MGVGSGKARAQMCGKRGEGASVGDTAVKEGRVCSLRAPVWGGGREEERRLCPRESCMGRGSCAFETTPPSLKGRKGGVHAVWSPGCQLRACWEHPLSSPPLLSPCNLPTPPRQLGTQFPGAVLGLPGIKVTPQANLNTAPYFFHPPQGLVVNSPSGSGQSFYGPRT